MATPSCKLVSVVCLVAAGLLAVPVSAKSPQASPPPDSVLDLSAISTPPKILQRVAPRYPKELRRRGITGEALVAFIIRSNGDVTEVEAVRATHPEFAEAAMACVSQWKFRPARKDGQPVNCRMQVPIVFTLNDGR